MIMPAYKVVTAPASILSQEQAEIFTSLTEAQKYQAETAGQLYQLVTDACGLTDAYWQEL